MHNYALLSLVIFSLLLSAACSGQQTSPAADTTAHQDNPTPEQRNHVQIIDGKHISYAVHGSGPICMVLPNSWGVDIAALRGLFNGLEQEPTLQRHPFSN